MRWPWIISKRGRRTPLTTPAADPAGAEERDGFIRWLAEYRQKLDRFVHQSERTAKEDKERV